MLSVQLFHLLYQIVDDSSLGKGALADPLVGVQLHAVYLPSESTAGSGQWWVLTFVVFSNFFKAFRNPVRFIIFRQIHSLDDSTGIQTHSIILDQLELTIELHRGVAQVALVLGVSFRTIRVMLHVVLHRLS
jgi:hypothetical protein